MIETLGFNIWIDHLILELSNKAVQTTYETIFEPKLPKFLRIVILG